jgi:hypothetical protein
LLLLKGGIKGDGPGAAPVKPQAGSEVLAQTARKGKGERMEYTIRELQDRQSMCRGTIIEAVSLASAKRQASKMQLFQGTVLTVSAKNGNVMCVKENGKWEDLF